MHKFISRGLLTVLFTGGLMALGIGAANAADNTSGDDGTGSGSQAILGINLPITIGGNGISVLGDSSSNGASTSTPAAPSAPSGSTSGDVSLLGGTQAIVDADVPVTVGGNAISVLGDSSSTGSSTGSSAGSDGTPGPMFTGDDGTGASGDGASTSGSDSTLGGTQVLGDVNAPVTVGGNAISVAGDSKSSGSTIGRGFAGETGGGAPTTSGDSGIASGTQVVPDVAAPVLVGGNAVSLLGDSSSSGSSASSGGATGASGSGSAPTTSGFDSILGGTQVAPDATAPVTASGNAVSVVGDSTSTGPSTAGGSSGTGSTSTAPTTSGSGSLLGGTQVVPDVTAPVSATGDAISVVGDSSSTGATGNGGGSVGGVDTTADGASTSGDNSTGGGSQIAPVIRIPVTVGGNAVSVVGDSSTTTTDPGQPGEVGGVEVFAPTDPTVPTTATPGTINTAAVTEQSLLASTGVTVLPALLLGLMLLLLGAAARVRAVTARR